MLTFKDIMGITQKVDALEINAAADVVNAMAKDVAEKIIELNGGKYVNAVDFVVGGGGRMPVIQKELPIVLEYRTRELR